jgi:hypothetical protein
MNKHLIVFVTVAFFFILGIIILLDQYLSNGILFQIEDIHHETFALASFTLAVGILIGSNYPKKLSSE